MKEKKEIQGIKCEATECVYNEDKDCVAGTIHVGHNYATNAEETACETFQCDENCQ
ncbi:MAG: DUF1540 domain-containing protein [Clostridiales bacterium]|nr:DUF1540 domain-containing protein [Clostridiales bacterium]